MIFYSQSTIHDAKSWLPLLQLVAMKLRGSKLSFFGNRRLLLPILRRLHSPSLLRKKEDVHKIRNIGVMAHIDAGDFKYQTKRESYPLIIKKFFLP